MRVLVTGSRKWTDRSMIGDALRWLDYDEGHEITIVHGAAVGADTIVAEEALALDMNVEPHPAGDDPKVRNVEMLESGIDMVLAFPMQGSRGTWHTVNEAKRRGIPVKVFLA